MVWYSSFPLSQPPLSIIPSWWWWCCDDGLWNANPGLELLLPLRTQKTSRADLGWNMEICDSFLLFFLGFLQKTALSLVNSSLALRSRCCSFGCSFGCHHAENGQMHRKMVLECSIMINIHKWYPFPDQEWGKIGRASLFHSWHWVLFFFLAVQDSSIGDPVTQSVRQ